MKHCRERRDIVSPSSLYLVYLYVSRDLANDAPLTPGLNVQLTIDGCTATELPR